MPVYVKMTPKQKEWAEYYEKLTGFEPMYQEDLRDGEITFKEFVKMNIGWYAGDSLDTIDRIKEYAKNKGLL